MQIVWITTKSLTQLIDTMLVISNNIVCVSSVPYICILQNDTNTEGGVNNVVQGQKHIYGCRFFSWKFHCLWASYQSRFL